MTAGETMTDRGTMMNGNIQNLETQQVSTISCIARTAGYRGNTLRINTLHERALKAFRSAGLREDESERALDERDKSTGGKSRQTGLEGAVGKPCALSGTQLRPAKRTNQPHTHTKPLPPRFPSWARTICTSNSTKLYKKRQHHC